MNMWVNISGEMFNISKIHAGDAEGFYFSENSAAFQKQQPIFV